MLGDTVSAERIPLFGWFALYVISHSVTSHEIVDMKSTSRSSLFRGCISVEHFASMGYRPEFSID